MVWETRCLTSMLADRGEGALLRLRVRGWMGWGGVTDLDINKTFGCSSAGTGRLAGWEEAASPTRRPHAPTTRVMCGDNSTVWVGWGGGRGAGGRRGFRNRGSPEWGWSRWESRRPRRSLGGRPPPSSAAGDKDQSAHRHMSEKHSREGQRQIFSPSGFPLGPQTT